MPLTAEREKEIREYLSYLHPRFDAHRNPGIIRELLEEIDTLRNQLAAKEAAWKAAYEQAMENGSAARELTREVSCLRGSVELLRVFGKHMIAEVGGEETDEELDSALLSTYIQEKIKNARTENSINAPKEPGSLRGSK